MIEKEKQQRVYLALLQLFHDLDVTLDEFVKLVHKELQRGVELARVNK